MMGQADQMWMDDGAGRSFFAGRMDTKNVLKWQVAAVQRTSGKMSHENIENCMQNKKYASHHWEALLVPAVAMRPRTRMPAAGCMPARASAKFK